MRGEENVGKNTKSRTWTDTHLLKCVLGSVTEMVWRNTNNSW